MDLYEQNAETSTSTANRTGPTQTLTQGQHRHFRELVCEATKLDRHILSKELLAFQVEAGEATDNTNKVSTRLNGSTVRFIKRFADDYGITASALLREAVEFAVTNKLYPSWHELPDRANVDDE